MMMMKLAEMMEIIRYRQENAVTANRVYTYTIAQYTVSHRTLLRFFPMMFGLHFEVLLTRKLSGFLLDEILYKNHRQM